ncbi:MAG: NUDIX hydrolase [Propionibacteriaceae bacterium]|jgi:8-oxo-dGTP diphosphatase|nr:NUDIX hydrolase [Propionibacteriaceae bacterium]
MSIGSQIPVWAAGAVTLRGMGGEREVLLVHRPVYDDWSLPKGKPHSTELLPTAAVREVAEESSARIRLAAPLTPTRYPLSQALKIVSWWVGVVHTATDHVPNAEVDAVAWIPADAALGVMTYADERGVLAEAMTVPTTTPLVILRHAKALRRDGWNKPDAARPLGSRGRDQLPYVAQVLRPFGVSHLISSPATRCLQTLAPYAKTIKSDITTADLLSENAADDGEVAGYMRRLAKAVGASGTPTVVCGHRPVLPAMLAGLGQSYRPMSTASCLVAHLDHHGVVVATEWYDTLRVKV